MSNKNNKFNILYHNVDMVTKYNSFYPKTMYGKLPIWKYLVLYV